MTQEYIVLVLIEPDGLNIKLHNGNACAFQMVYEAGEKGIPALSELAPCIRELRKAGLDIETVGDERYILRSSVSVFGLVGPTGSDRV